LYENNGEISMRIAWGITGAGHLLQESVNVLVELSKEHEVTVLLSGAGEEVLKMYGLYETVKNITGGKYRELVMEDDQRASFPMTGRFSLGTYDLLVVSPTTSNTIGKIVNGIADNLITNAVAQSGKGLVITYIVPVDLESGDLQTVLPSKLELDLCQNCETCLASAACPNNAITPGVEINLLKCKGCGACQVACHYGAVTGGRLITIHMRDIDIQNTTKLCEVEGINVLRHPQDLKKILS
jgi:dihydromethanopterin reductase (acceptor)